MGRSASSGWASGQSHLSRLFRDGGGVLEAAGLRVGGGERLQRRRGLVAGQFTGAPGQTHGLGTIAKLGLGDGPRGFQASLHSAMTWSGFSRRVSV